MLKTVVRAHRPALRAHTADVQKLFVMLKLIPSREVVGARPPLALAFVVDTSASMRMFVDQDAARRLAGQNRKDVKIDGGDYHSLDVNLPTLLDQATEAVHAMIDDPRLLPADSVSIVHFDDEAQVLLPLTPLTDKAQAHAAVEQLKNYAGETYMAKGLYCAMQEMSRVSPETAKRIFVLTDGATFDEVDCREQLPRMSALNAPLVAIGFGEEYNEELMAKMADMTSGRPYHLRQMSDLVQEVLEREVGQTTREVVTDLRLDIAAVKGVHLDKIHRAHPWLGEVSSDQQPYRLGNISAGDYTVYILEFSISGVVRAPSRARLVQLKLSGSTPGIGSGTRALPALEVVVEFTGDVAATGQVDPEVIGYVQQKNVGQLVEEAVAVASYDTQRAQQSLQAASGMTRQLGNTALSHLLDDAMDELHRSGTISPQTRKTVALGTRTKTVKTAAVSDAENDLSPEEIRRLSGT